jgi:hypothetical protein
MTQSDLKAAREFLKKQKGAWERLPGLVDEVVPLLAAYGEHLLASEAQLTPSQAAMNAATVILYPFRALAGKQQIEDAAGVIEEAWKGVASEPKTPGAEGLAKEAAKKIRAALESRPHNTHFQWLTNYQVADSSLNIILDALRRIPGAEERQAGPREVTDQKAVESACAYIEKVLGNAPCDGDAVSNCLRCNAVYLAKKMREVLSSPEATGQAPRDNEQYLDGVSISEWKANAAYWKERAEKVKAGQAGRTEGAKVTNSLETWYSICRAELIDAIPQMEEGAVKVHAMAELRACEKYLAYLANTGPAEPSPEPTSPVSSWGSSGFEVLGSLSVIAHACVVAKESAIGFTQDDLQKIADDMRAAAAKLQKEVGGQ